MDAQSVERVRLEEEYERESRHGKLSPKANAAAGPPIPLEEATSPESGRTQRKHKHGNAKGKSKSKSTESGRKHRHHHQSHQGRSDKHIDDKSRIEGNTQQDTSSPAKERNIEVHSISGRQDNSNNGCRGMQQSASPMVGPGADVNGFDPNSFPASPNFPWYSEQGHYAQVPLQPPGMPMQNAPWGQQASQAFVNQPTMTSQFGQNPVPFGYPPPGLASFQPPLFHEQPFDQTARMNAPSMPAAPFPGAEEYSPRTLPSALRLPFPPFGLVGGETSQAWGMSGSVPNGGIPQAQWPGPPSENFRRVPPGPMIPLAAELTSIQFASPKAPNERNEGHSPRDQGSKTQSPVTTGTDERSMDPKEALDGLRARMKKHAEASRTALESEKSGRKTSEQRMAALEKLVSPSSKKVSRIRQGIMRYTNGGYTIAALDCAQDRWCVRQISSKGERHACAECLPDIC
jgi:hypothetical protein